MEYVGGKSLNTILKDRWRPTADGSIPCRSTRRSRSCRGPPGVLLPARRRAAVLRLQARQPIQVGDTIKLIDLGGVRRIGDDSSPIYGTIGFQAPEVPAEGTSIASDIYTIARTLAVLIFEFKGFQTQYEHSLPDQAASRCSPSTTRCTGCC